MVAESPAGSIGSETCGLSDKMKRKRKRRFKTILVVIGCVIALPVILPYILIADAFADRRRKRDADTFTCTQCGNVLGRASIAKANEIWREHVRELYKRFPGARIHLVLNVWDICSVYGAQYNYHERDRTYILRPTQDDGPAVTHQK